MSDILKDWLTGLTINQIAVKHNITKQQAVKLINEGWKNAN